jgi:hypothetical protein
VHAAQRRAAVRLEHDNIGTPQRELPRAISRRNILCKLDDSDFGER